MILCFALIVEHRAIHYSFAFAFRLLRMEIARNAWKTEKLPYNDIAVATNSFVSTADCAIGNFFEMESFLANGTSRECMKN